MLTVIGACIVSILGSSEMISFALLHKLLAWDSLRSSPFQIFSLSAVISFPHVLQDPATAAEEGHEEPGVGESVGGVEVITLYEVDCIMRRV